VRRRIAVLLVALFIVHATASNLEENSTEENSSVEPSTEVHSSGNRRSPRSTCLQFLVTFEGGFICEYHFASEICTAISNQYYYRSSSDDYVNTNHDDVRFIYTYGGKWTLCTHKSYQDECYLYGDELYKDEPYDIDTWRAYPAYIDDDYQGYDKVPIGLECNDWDTTTTTTPYEEPDEGWWQWSYISYVTAPLTFIIIITCSMRHRRLRIRALQQQQQQQQQQSAQQGAYPPTTNFAPPPTSQTTSSAFSAPLSETNYGFQSAFSYNSSGGAYPSNNTTPYPPTNNPSPYPSESLPTYDQLTGNKR